MYETIIQKTHRVPRIEGQPGDGSAVARQLDAVLLQVGFSASREVLEHVASLNPGAAMDLAAGTVRAVRHLVGDHVQHNAYFIRFPQGVPDTMEFWVESLRAALVPAAQGFVGSGELDVIAREIVLTPGFNLLSLPTYGRYQHSFADLLAAHDALVETSGDRVTMLTLGDTVEQETERLYLQLAGSTVPLGEADLELLGVLAADQVGVVPSEIPVRESRAVVNRARLAAARPLAAVNTVTDVLRVAVAASDGDVSLQNPTRFRSFARWERRVLLGALHAVVTADRNKLADVSRFAEPWKRLGERLHAGEYSQFPGAQEVFAVARGEVGVPSLAARFEASFRAEDRAAAARVLSVAPGALLRSADRLLRSADDSELEDLVGVLSGALRSASARVLLSLCEHLINRGTPDVARVFVGRSRRAWVAPDERAPLPRAAVRRLTEEIDRQLMERLPEVAHLVIDPAAMDVALPLSGRASEEGFAVLPRGSRSRLDPKAADTLRFFIYWREAQSRTDFDLSVAMLDKDFRYVSQVSYTNYHARGVTHSGDLTESRNGATEFIDVRWDGVASSVHYIVPQVNVYSGENFGEVEESMFGYMVRDHRQKGMPFEPRTVRTRSEMRGEGRVALPLAFARNDDDSWSAVWSHLYLRGHAAFNRVEGNRLSTALLLRSVVERRYLSMDYLLELLGDRAGHLSFWQPGMQLSGPVTFVGLERPDGLPEGSEVFTPDRFKELLPG